MLYLFSIRVFFFIGTSENWFHNLKIWWKFFHFIFDVQNFIPTKKNNFPVFCFILSDDITKMDECILCKDKRRWFDNELHQMNGNKWVNRVFPSISNCMLVFSTEKTFQEKKKEEEKEINNVETSLNLCGNSIWWIPLCFGWCEPNNQITIRNVSRETNHLLQIAFRIYAFSCKFFFFCVRSSNSEYIQSISTFLRITFHKIKWMQRERGEPKY